MCRAQGHSYNKIMKTPPPTATAQRMAIGKADPNAGTSYSETAQRMAIGKVTSPAKLGTATPETPPAFANRGADTAAEASFGRSPSLLGAIVSGFTKLGG